MEINRKSTHWVTNSYILTIEMCHSQQLSVTSKGWFSNWKSFHGHYVTSTAYEQAVMCKQLFLSSHSTKRLFLRFSGTNTEPMFTRKKNIIMDVSISLNGNQQKVNTLSHKFLHCTSQACSIWLTSSLILCWSDGCTVKVDKSDVLCAAAATDVSLSLSTSEVSSGLLNQ